LIVAMALFEVVQTPPGVVLEYVVLAPTQRTLKPVIGLTEGGVHAALRAISLLVCLKLPDAVAVPVPVAPADAFIADAAPTPLSLPLVVLASTISAKAPGLVVVHPEMVDAAPCEVAVNINTLAFAVVVVIEAALNAVPVAPAPKAPETSIGVVASTPE
jgi:hypothetical protein